MLGLTPAERVQHLQGTIDLVRDVRRVLRATPRTEESRTSRLRWYFSEGSDYFRFSARFPAGYVGDARPSPPQDGFHELPIAISSAT
jgi:hypothetical protein